MDDLALETGNLARLNGLGEGQPMDLKTNDILRGQDARCGDKTSLNEPFRRSAGKECTVVVQIFAFYQAVIMEYLGLHHNPFYKFSSLGTFRIILDCTRTGSMGCADFYFFHPSQPQFLSFSTGWRSSSKPSTRMHLDRLILSLRMSPNLTVKKLACNHSDHDVEDLVKVRSNRLNIH